MLCFVNVRTIRKELGVFSIFLCEGHVTCSERLQENMDTSGKSITQMNPGIVVKESNSPSGSTIAIIVVCVILVIAAVVLAVVLSTSVKNTPKPRKCDVRAMQDNGGYTRSMPSELNVMGAAALVINPGSGADESDNGTSLAQLSEVPTLTAASAQQQIDALKELTVVLFSHSCPACVRLVQNIKEWVKTGKLDGKKVAFMPMDEWKVLSAGKLKDALKSTAVPFSVKFKDGIASTSKLGAVPQDVFMELVSS